MSTLTLAGIRQKYPQYAKIPDAQLAEGLRKKFYPQMNPDEFGARVGYTPTPRSRALADAYSALGSDTNAKGVMNAAGQGGAFGFIDELGGGLAAAKTAVQNAAAGAGIGKPAGYGASDAYHATVDADRQRLGAFAKREPGLNFASEIGGSLLNPLSIGAGGFVARGGGLLARGAENTLARSALAGGALGAAQGAGNAEGGVLSRLQGAGVGGAIGAVTGAAVPVVAGGAGKVIDGVVAPTARLAGRLTAKATGNINPQATALKQLTASMTKDGVTPDLVRQAQNDWLTDGGVKPSTLDLIMKASPTGGQNTLSMVQGSAMKGGRGAATTYANSVGDNLQDAAIARTRQLTPDNQATALQYGGQLAETQDGLAANQFAGPYQTPVQLTPQIASAIGDQPGQAAVSRAIKGAVARRDYGQVQDLKTLQGATPDLSGLPPNIAEQAQAKYLAQQPPISAGALDRVRIALARGGEQAQMNPGTRDIGAGLFGRAADLNSALDAVPELAPARATYGAYAANRDAVQLGESAIKTSPNVEDFADALQGHAAKVANAQTLNQGADIPIPNANQSAGVGYRDAAVTRLGSQPDGATGALNRLVNTNSTGYQDAIFGPDVGQSYRNSIGNMIDQVNAARKINPNAGSDTASRLASQQLVDMPKIPHIPTTYHGMLPGALNKLRSMGGLTDGEQAALVNMNVTQNPEDLDALLKAFAENPAKVVPPPVAPRLAAPAGLAATDLYQNAQ